MPHRLLLLDRLRECEKLAIVEFIWLRAQSGSPDAASEARTVSALLDDANADLDRLLERIRRANGRLRALLARERSEPRDCGNAPGSSEPR